MREIFLLTGSNRGDRQEMILRASMLIAEKAGSVLKKSSILETPPWGFTDPVAFLNQALEIETDLPPAQLLSTLLDIETLLGRTRSARPSGYASRTMDIDILFYGQQVMQTTTLTIPHPRLHERYFALKPLTEIAPGFIHPVLGKTISQLLQQLDNQP